MYVELDGPMQLADAGTPSFGVARMGTQNFIPSLPPIYPPNVLTNIVVAVLDTGVGPHPDLNVVNSVGFADTTYNGVPLNGNDWNGNDRDVRAHHHVPVLLAQKPRAVHRHRHGQRPREDARDAQ